LEEAGGRFTTNQDPDMSEQFGSRNLGAVIELMHWRILRDV
jgi:hypothetical protein